MTEKEYKKFVTLIFVMLQAIGAILLLSHRNPELHWCAIFPIIGSMSLLYIYVKWLEQDK